MNVAVIVRDSIKQYEPKYREEMIPALALEYPQWIFESIYDKSCKMSKQRKSWRRGSITVMSDWSCISWSGAFMGR
jgi:hypothetical protein